MKSLGLAVALLLCSVSASAQPKLDLQELSDREEIRTLLLNYGRYLDDRELEKYAKLFAANGEWSGGFGTARTPSGILAMMTKAFANSPNEPASRNYHVMTNMIVDVEGDRGTAWSRWTFYVKGADNRPSVMIAGRYMDDLVRENGEWKFLRRLVISDIPFQDPAQAKQN
jgi:3-phenylpropionate/cinnamic acid dioxygenase small subunit